MAKINIGLAHIYFTNGTHAVMQIKRNHQRKKIPNSNLDLMKNISTASHCHARVARLPFASLDCTSDMITRSEIAQQNVKSPKRKSLT